MGKRSRAEGLLVLATVFWSISYYFTVVCLAELDALNLNAFRFLTAFLILGFVYRGHLRGLTKETLRAGVVIGCALVFTYIGATYGVKYTSLSNAGFISCLAVIFTPVLELIFCHKTPERKLGLALVLCTVGLGLMTLGDGVRFAKGDLLCLLCSVSYAADILITERAVSDPAVDPIGVSVVEIGVTGAVMLLLSLVFEQPTLPSSPQVWGAGLFLGLFCSGLAFVIQTTQQQYTSAARVALIFTLEPVFSAVFAYFLAGERLLPRNYFGAFLMLVSLLVMQLGSGKKDTA